MKRSYYSNAFEEEEEEDRQLDNNIKMANVLMLLSRNQIPNNQHRVFECKTCNRQFSSFQALGGHRASHKKPKPSDTEDDSGNQSQAQSKPKMHECSICGVEFAIGQALGGHMRRHRAHNEGFGDGAVEKKRNNGKSVLLLDLNFPPLGPELGSPMLDSFR